MTRTHSTDTLTPTTLTAFKRMLKPGMQFEVLDHWIPKYIGTTRTVVQVQGNGYRFTQEGEDGRCWSPYPGAKEVTFGPGWQVRMQPMEDRYWVLRLVEGGDDAED